MSLPFLRKKQLQRQKEEASFYGNLIAIFSLEFSVIAKFSDGNDDIWILLFNVWGIVLIVLELFWYYMEVINQLMDTKTRVQRSMKRGKTMKTNNPIAKFFLLCLMALLILPSAAFAAQQTVEADGHYTIGDGMEEDFSLARERAKQDALGYAAELLQEGKRTLAQQC